MSRICMVYHLDHTRHIIIQRQLNTLCAAGHEAAVYDHAVGRLVHYTRDSRRERKPWLPLRAWRKGLYLLGNLLLRWQGRDEEWRWADEARIWLNLVRAAPLLVSAKADVYHAHDLESLMQAAVAARLRRRPLIYDAHELGSEMGTPGAPRSRRLRDLEQRFAPCADRVIVPNRFRAEIYRTEFRLKAEPVVVMNCPPLVRYPKTARLRQELALPADARIVLYHGVLKPNRGLEQLVLSARHLNQGTALVFIGEQGDFYREVLAPLGRAENVQGNVYFLPYVSPAEIMSYVCSADLGVVIYRNTNRNNYLCAPTKLYEYVMAGIPFVGCNFPEVKSFLQQYPLGAIFDPENPLSISEAVNSFLDAASARQDELLPVFEQARQRFNWQVEGQHLLGLLDSFESRQDGRAA